MFGQHGFFFFLQDKESESVPQKERRGGMFQKGEFIIYGNKGVCEVTDISKIAISGASRDRLSQGKKITAMDRKYFKMAEDNLYGELSVSLEIPKEKMEEYITEKVGMQMQEDAESFMEYSIE